MYYEKTWGRIISERKVLSLYKVLFEAIMESLSVGSEVTITGFGSFRRVVVDPVVTQFKGDKVYVPKKTKVYFRMSQEFRKLMRERLKREEGVYDFDDGDTGKSTR
jgi:nucleoid DNA-binding protein